MNILLLCEGDAESPVESFSGISKSVLENLRHAGDSVETGDCDLYGFARYLAALPEFSTDRRRWAARYHLGGWPFVLRSRKAERHLARHRGRPDAILQFGATFRAPGAGSVPYFLYCDSNIRVAQKGAGTGHSWAASLGEREIDEIARRELQVYDGAAAVFTLSDNLRESFLIDFGLAADKVITARAGPNLEVTDIRMPRVRRAGVPPTILFVGAQFERKGGDLLLSAFREVRSRVAGARLLIVGPREAGAEEGVEWLGFLRKDVPSDAARLKRAYEEADVFCLPTRFEPFGIVFIEAMYHGIPCVGTRAWAVPEMVLDGVTGFTIEVDDRIALADRLVYLLQNPEVAARFGEAGRRHAERSFTWKAVTEIMRARMLDHISGAAART